MITLNKSASMVYVYAAATITWFVMLTSVIVSAFIKGIWYNIASVVIVLIGNGIIWLMVDRGVKRHNAKIKKESELIAKTIYDMMSSVNNPFASMHRLNISDILDIECTNCGKCGKNIDETEGDIHDR
jgi:hypothetical protein